MQILESFLTENSCYKKNVHLDVKGLVLHSVGCAQPNASVFLKNWNKSGLTKCVHGFIDANTGIVYQTLPWDMRGWQCGGKGNDTHIGVEMCESSAIKYTHGAEFTVVDEKAAKEHAIKAYMSAVELFAMLCEKFNLDPMAHGVIVSHNEAHKLGIASGHVDPEHYWTGLGLEYTMDTFRADVSAKMGKVVVTKPKVEEKKPEPVKSPKLQPSQYKLDSLTGTYMSLASDGLNIRQGASVSDSIIGVMPVGAKCRCYGYYNVNGITKWLLIQYEGITGYVNSNFLRRV